MVETLKAHLQDLDSSLEISALRCESAKPEDLTAADVLVLATGTWNTGGIEGQLNPHMHTFLLKTCKKLELKGQKCGRIALGDDRYFYTAGAGKHLESFVETHGGELVGEELTIVNEPYGQEDKIKTWAKDFLATIT